MKRKLLSFALCLAMALSLLPMSALADGNTGAWTDSGNYDTSWYNTTDHSFTISTAAELAGLAAIVNGAPAGLPDKFTGKTVTLAADVDLAGHDWTPIGDASTKFAGTFDGGGHKISNMTVNISGDNLYAGLFGYCDGTITNLSAVGVNITASGDRPNVGGIMGFCEKNGAVTNCTVGGSITAAGTVYSFAGGIVGHNNDGKIKNCAVTGTVSTSGGSQSECGGIAGYGGGSQVIENCSSAAAASATGGSAANDCGGIIGVTAGGKIANCFNTGSATVGASSDNNLACGIAGQTDYTAITNCYSLNSGIVIEGMQGTVNCASFTEAQGKGTDSTFSYTIGTGGEQTGTLLAALNAYVAANDDSTLKYWKQGSTSEGADYPVFCDTWEEALGVKGEVDISDGNIDNAWDLAQLAATFNGGANQNSVPYSMGSDVDLGLYNWVPIGDGRIYSEKQATFDGIFSGDGHSITGMRISETASSGTVYAGLFGILDGSVSGLQLSGGVAAALTGENTCCYAGGVAGYNNGGMNGCVCSVKVALTGGAALYAGGVAGFSPAAVYECSSAGAVSASGAAAWVFAGGVAGKGVNAEDCANTGSVTAAAANYAWAGGIIGSDSLGAITGCQNSGAVSVTGSECYAGGVAGELDSESASASLTNCANTGAVTGTPAAASLPGSTASAFVGGLVGQTQGSQVSSVTVANSYNTGNVTAAVPAAAAGPSAAVGAAAGGLVGGLGGTPTLKLCYNAGAVSGSEGRTGGLAGSAAGAPAGSAAGAPAQYCYWLLSTPSPGVGVGPGHPFVSAAESAALAAELNSGVSVQDNPAAYLSWRVDPNLNGGYPVFVSGNWADGDDFTGAPYYADTSWYGNGSAESFTITTAAELAGLAALVNNGDAATFAGKTVTLGADIDLSAHYWTPIGVSDMGGNSDAYFAGAFEGAGHTVSGMHVRIVQSRSDVYAGLFGYIDYGGAVSKVNVTGSVSVGVDSSDPCYAGGIAGYNNGEITDSSAAVPVVAAISNEHIYDGVLTAAGGIAGWNLIAKNCWHSGRVSASGGYYSYAGGIAGYNKNGNINNCYHTSANGGVTAANGETGNYAGGAAGCLYSCQITNSYWLKGTADAAVGQTEENGGALYCASFTSDQGRGTDASFKYTIVYGEQTGTLLSALNAWVQAENSLDYFGWAATEDVNSGYPVLGARYTVNFDVNYVGGTNPDSMTAVNGGAYGTLPDPARTGYTLDGWYTDAANGTKIEAADTVDLSADQTLYAHWTAAVYTVTLNFSGGTGTDLASYTYGTGATLPTDLTKSGYSFGGWYDNAKLKGTAVTAISNTDTGAKEYWAKWTAKSPILIGGDTVKNYALSFDTNGGGALSDVTAPDGTKLGLAGYVPVRENYDFGGWYSDAALTKPVTDVTLTDNVTVYAKWTAKSTVSPANPFTDVREGDFYYDAVLWAVKNSVTGGKTPTLFAPLDECTRAQVVTFLWRAMGSPEPASAVNPFTDVSPDAYYYKAVLWAVEKGITKGTGGTTFSPDRTVTRGEFVTFLWRAAGSPAPSGTGAFTDVTDEGAFYYSAVLWASQQGITGGKTPTVFAPGDACTRGQVAAFLFRWFGK